MISWEKRYRAIARGRAHQNFEASTSVILEVLLGTKI